MLEKGFPFQEVKNITAVFGCRTSNLKKENKTGKTFQPKRLLKETQISKIVLDWISKGLAFQNYDQNRADILYKI